MSRPSLIRPARPSDLDALATIQHVQPTPEFLGLVRDPARARALGRALAASEGIGDADRPVVVLDEGGGPVAFMRYTVGQSEPAMPHIGSVVAAARALGVGVFGLPRRLAARRSVRLHVPDDSLYIAELHVHPAVRGRGLGGRLLEWSADECMARGLPQRSLITGSDSPAIRLYERHGFTIVDAATDRRYARYFGQAGRVLMTSPAVTRA